MEDRIYKFASRKYHVSYMVTEEELKVLNKSYNHQDYCERQQNAINNVVLFSEIDSEEFAAEELIKGNVIGVEQNVVGGMFVEELLALLTEEERSVVISLIMDKEVISDLCEELQKSRFSIMRTRDRALEKMKRYLEAMGITSFGDAMLSYLY